MSRKLLVTGAAGFIGSGFVELSLTRGYDIVGLDALTYAGHRENLENLKGPGQFELVVGDICDSKLVSDLIKRAQPDAILNFAAESHVDRSIEGPAAFIRTNVTGTYTLLDNSLEYWKSLSADRKNSFRYLQVSTDEVYGSLGSTGKFTETTPIASNSPYSASKASGDLFVRAWHHTYGLPTLTTNCSNNYGPKQFPEKLIPHMITCALAGKALPVYGDGGNVRDWIHVMDHCAGVLLALEKGRPGETYCFGGNAEHGNLDLVRTICHELDRRKPRSDGKKHETGIQFVTDRPGHDRRYAIDSCKAETELGFARKYAFEKGLADTVQWYLDNQKWCEAVLQKGALK